MTRKALKKLCLRVPPDHPIFDLDIEPRQRTKIARNWLDIGANISSIEARISCVETKVLSIEAGMPRIEKQLAEIMAMLGKLDKGERPKPSQKAPPVPEDAGEFDAVAFGKSMEEAFI